MASHLPRWTPAFYQRGLGMVQAVGSAMVGSGLLSVQSFHSWHLFIAAGMVYGVCEGMGTWLDGRIAGRAEARALLAAPPPVSTHE